MICPGNHDDRAAFRQFLLGQPASAAPINQVHHTADVVIALCDSSVPDKNEGLLADETLAWLADVLDQTPDQVPVLVGFHHPPAVLHVPFLDEALRPALNVKIGEIAEPRWVGWPPSLSDFELVRLAVARPLLGHRSEAR
jgi:3',5'-cyclic AMP phosphodiesterase CpdA